MALLFPRLSPRFGAFSARLGLDSWLWGICVAVLFVASLSSRSAAADAAPAAWKILGPIDLPADDGPASSPVAALLAESGSAMESAGSTLWHEGSPYRWMSARQEPDGAIWVRRQFSSARQSGNVVFLFARLTSAAPREQAVEIARAGRVDLWLDSKPLAPTYRDADRCVWRLRPGTESAVLIRSRAPYAAAPWKISIRFVDPSFLPARAASRAQIPSSFIDDSLATGVAEACEDSAAFLAQRDGMETAEAGTDASEGAPGGGRPWKIRLPPGWTVPPSDRRVPLLVMLPNQDETPDDALARQNDLADEALRREWIVLVPHLPPYGSDLRYRIRPIEIARVEAMETLPVDPARVYLVASGDSAETGLSLVLLRGEDYAGGGFVDGRWTHAIPWESLLLGRLPRPALFFASRDRAAADPLRGLELRLNDKEGAWQRGAIDPNAPVKTLTEMLDFLSNRPFDVGPLHVLVSNRSAACERSRWLFLRQPQNPYETATLSADRVSSSVTVLDARNAAQFDALLRDMPGLDRSRAITFRIGRQRLQIFPRVPDAIRCSFVERDGEAPHWQAEELTEDPENFATREKTALSNLKRPLPAWPTESNGGVAGLLARAARQAANARVALIPSDGVFSGQDAGPVYSTDLEAWFFDCELCTATVSTANLMRVLEQDYAGPRFVASDGVGAVATPPQPALEIDEAAQADEADAPTSTGATVSSDQPPSLAQTGQAEIADGPVFQSCALADAGDTVVVASWKGWFERWSRGLGLKIETARPETSAPSSAARDGSGAARTRSLPGADTGIRAAGITQRGAILKLLDAEPSLAPPAPSIGGLPVKEPVAMKRRVSR